MSALDFSVQQAAIAAVVQGNLPQLRIVVESINARLEALESLEGQGEHQHPSPDLSAVSEVKPPADDAKTIEIRETVIDLVDSFNALLKAIKGDAVDG